MTELPPVAILAGGLGSRLGKLTAGTPKPLLEVAGKPFLVHQIELLARHGATQVVLCVGYLGDQIEARVGPELAGVSISYSYDDFDFHGTLGAIRKARPLLGDPFLVLYGDTYLQIDYQQVAERWASSGLPACMSVLHNRGEWGISNARLVDDLVVAYDKTHGSAIFEWIDYGLTGLTDRALAQVEPNNSDLAHLFSRLAARRDLFGFEATERFYEIGTPTALAETEAFLIGARMDP